MDETQKNNAFYILAIESSCDDTAAAVFRNEQLITQVTSTQLEHVAYGGVVPEVASRAHQTTIGPVVDQCLKKAGVRPQDLSAVAVTIGPGLLGSLLVGVSFAKGLALALNIPLIDVHHIRAHVMAHWIAEPRPPFPMLCLVVSGGHTQLLKVKDHNKMEILGETMDDAVGEAFDKTGKMLGLPYPAGPVMDKLAQKGTRQFSFAHPEPGGLNFSFSGFKTSVLYFLQKQQKLNEQFISENLNDLCCSIQADLVEILLNKLKKAVAQSGLKHVGVAGGVSANSLLRGELQALAEKEGWQLYIPAMAYCTDNAAMIGMTAWFKYQNREFATLDIVPRARYALDMQF